MNRSSRENRASFATCCGGRGADFVSIQSFEWCFNRLSLSGSRQFGRNVSPTIATRARVSFQSLMSYRKDYVEGKLPVYRHSSRHSQEIRFIRFSTCSRRTRSSNATCAGLHCRGNPSRNPGLRPYSPALRAPHRAPRPAPNCRVERRYHRVPQEVLFLRSSYI